MKTNYQTPPILCFLEDLSSEERLKVFLDEIVKGYDCGFEECVVLFPKEMEGLSPVVRFDTPMGITDLSYDEFYNLVSTWVPQSRHYKKALQERLQMALGGVRSWA